MRYRKKPVVIEAEQFVLNSTWPKQIYRDSVCPTGFVVDTLEGCFAVSDGDWIITGVVNEVYPCKPEVFDLTYERVE